MMRSNTSTMTTSVLSQPLLYEQWERVCELAARTGLSGDDMPQNPRDLNCSERDRRIDVFMIGSSALQHVVAVAAGASKCCMIGEEPEFVDAGNLSLPSSVTGIRQLGIGNLKTSPELIGHWCDLLIVVSRISQPLNAVELKMIRRLRPRFAVVRVVYVALEGEQITRSDRLELSGYTVRKLQQAGVDAVRCAGCEVWLGGKASGEQRETQLAELFDLSEVDIQQARRACLHSDMLHLVQQGLRAANQRADSRPRLSSGEARELISQFRCFVEDLQSEMEESLASPATKANDLNDVCDEVLGRVQNWCEGRGREGIWFEYVSTFIPSLGKELPTTLAELCRERVELKEVQIHDDQPASPNSSSRNRQQSTYRWFDVFQDSTFSRLRDASLRVASHLTAGFGVGLLGAAILALTPVGRHSALVSMAAALGTIGGCLLSVKLRSGAFTSHLQQPRQREAQTVTAIRLMHGDAFVESAVDWFRNKTHANQVPLVDEWRAVARQLGIEEMNR